MTSCTYLGIDPGASGGMAAILPSGKVLVEPLGGRSLRDIWDWITDRLLFKDVEIFAVVEKVGGYIGASHARGSAMFNFGYGAGALEAFLIGAGIPYELVTPVTWIRPLGLPLRRRAVRSGSGLTSDGKVPETDRQWKARLRTKAQQLFPEVRVTLAVADALLIAEYNRRTRSKP